MIHLILLTLVSLADELITLGETSWNGTSQTTVPGSKFQVQSRNPRFAAHSNLEP
jgi:hypothetical protein